MTKNKPVSKNDLGGNILNLVDNIKKYMEMKNLNNNQLAKLLNIDRSNISRWFNGNQKPSLEQIEQLTKIFKCSYDDLLK